MTGDKVAVPGDQPRGRYIPHAPHAPAVESSGRRCGASLKEQPEWVGARREPRVGGHSVCIWLARQPVLQPAPVPYR